MAQQKHPAQAFTPALGTKAIRPLPVLPLCVNAKLVDTPPPGKPWGVFVHFANDVSWCVNTAENEPEAQSKADQLATSYLKLFLRRIDPAYTLDVTTYREKLAEFYDTYGYRTKMLLANLVELILSDMPVKIDTLSLINLPGPSDFDEAKSEVCRPYLAISDADFSALQRQSNAHYYLTAGGTIVTFGNATCLGSQQAYALMPVNASTVARILSNEQAALGQVFSTPPADVDLARVNSN